GGYPGAAADLPAVGGLLAHVVAHDLGGDDDVPDVDVRGDRATDAAQREGTGGEVVRQLPGRGHRAALALFVGLDTDHIAEALPDVEAVSVGCQVEDSPDSR